MSILLAAFFRKFEKIFATQGVPPVSTKPTVNLLSVVSLPPPSKTPALQLELRIFSRLFKGKIEMTIDLSGAQGKTNNEKKLEVKNLVTFSL